MNNSEILGPINQKVQDAFINNKRIMAFNEYVTLFKEHPTWHARSAAQYVKGTFDHFGTEETLVPFKTSRRFKLFDVDFDGGKDRMIAQERVQNDIYRQLTSFVHQGRVNKLILLHGPNGSAKSIHIACIMRALKHYSTLEEGALYRFNWIFPTGKVTKGGIGFMEGSGDSAAADSYAYLQEGQVAARLGCELKDHPLFLIPKQERQRLLDELLEDYPDFVVSDYIRHGDLCHKCRLIYDALLNAYHGDYLKVINHVQIERLFLSRRYRRGLVTVDPQLSVDAGTRQVTMDRSLSSLPTALQTVTIFETFGDLVDSNRGLLEFNDMLKRPMETYKYLLSTCEKSTVSLDAAILYLDVIFIGTSNEKHLMAFKEIPDFPSFKGRMELVKSPLLLRYSREKCIYDEQFVPMIKEKHVSPHTTWAAALWAVLTRLKRPEAQFYPDDLKEVIPALTPLEKAGLYDSAVLPEHLAGGKAKTLKAVLETLWEESRNAIDYEGRNGASPREIKTALFNAAQSTEYRCVSPQAVLNELSNLVKHTTVYDFLRQIPDGDYHDHPGFIEVVRARYLDILEGEARVASGLVEDGKYAELFERYIQHVSHWLKGDKVANQVTGKSEQANLKLMEEVENSIKAARTDKKEFRQALISRIGAQKIEHPDEPVNLHALFNKYVDRIQSDYFEKHRKLLSRQINDVLRLCTGEGDTLEREHKKVAERMKKTLMADFNYCEHCIPDVFGFLLKQRYSD